MNELISTSLTVSAIAICVIFLVLTILIFSIKLLVHFLPYTEPPAKPTRQTPPQQAETDEDVAVITSVMTDHLSRLPGNLRIVSIQSR